MERRDVEFNADGTTLRGWFYVPEGSGPFPTVVMAHGFSGVKEMTLDQYAEVFCKGGLAVLVYDNRNLGQSDGEPRHDIDPFAQRRDYRTAMTYAETLPEVDDARIGIWGTSYTGGAVLAVAALDHRVKCVVSQVPLIRGWQTLQQFLPIFGMDDFLKMLDDDRAARMRGEAPGTMKMCSDDPGEPCAFPGQDTWNFVSSFVDKLPQGYWENKVTLRSLEYLLEYDVTGYLDRIAPKPLLMIISDHDHSTPTDLALEAFSRCHEPKKLMVIRSHHYASYVEDFDKTSAAARDWFVEHLAR